MLKPTLDFDIIYLCEKMIHGNHASPVPQAETKRLIALIEQWMVNVLALLNALL